MRSSITGADGFIGKNLRVRLRELGDVEVVGITARHRVDELAAALGGGRLRVPSRRREPAARSTASSSAGNVGLHRSAVRQRCGGSGGRTPVVSASSTQAGSTIPMAAASAPRKSVAALRRARPDRRCDRVSAAQRVRQMVPAELQFRRGDLLPQHRARPADHDPRSGGAAARWSISTMSSTRSSACSTTPMRDAADLRGRPGLRDHRRRSGRASLQAFAESRDDADRPRASAPASSRALYATYVSYLPPRAFTYDVPRHGDPRGVFVEMLKTPDCGQFSYFTAHPGITRGEHYHHSKTEKFLVIQGTARFGFRHIETGETHEIVDQRRRGRDRRDGPRLGARHHQYRRRRADRHAVGERDLRSRTAGYLRDARSST